MKCIFKWNEVDLTRWQNEFTKIRRSTILQAYDYAKSVTPIYGQRPAWALLEIDGQPAGLMQISEASILWRTIHAVILDRGPLWFDGYGSDDHICAFIETYSNAFPARLGRKRRMIPEWMENKRITQVMSDNRWTLNAGSSYQTHWLDLTLDNEDLRRNLRKSWRQSLHKAEKSNLEISWDETGETLPLHLKHYALDKSQKGYDGPNVKIMYSLAKTAAKNKNILLGSASLDNKLVAGILVIRHGCSATYQIGWSSDKARSTCAHHRLLFEGVLKLKAMQVHDFDLGGMNETTAKSIKTFKTGMGGQTVTLAGLYT